MSGKEWINIGTAACIPPAHTDRPSTSPLCIHITTGAGSTEPVSSRMNCTIECVDCAQKWSCVYSTVRSVATGGRVTGVQPPTVSIRYQTAIRRDEGLESKQGGLKKGETPQGGGGV